MPLALDILAVPGLVLVIAQTLGANLPHTAVYLSVMVTVVSFLSQTVIQLLALPVLARQNDLQQIAGDRREALLLKLVEELCEHEGVAVPSDCEGTDA